MTKLPEGIFAPVATLFDNDGELDLDRFMRNMDWYATSPLDGVVVMGSNGEFVLLDEREKLQLIETALQAIGGRKVVMAGTGAESTRDTIRLTRAAAELGIDYALIVTPHYFRPRYDSDAFKHHYLSVAEASPVPVLIYIMTAFTGVDLPSPLINALSEHPNIIGVKDSAGNAAKLAEMVAASSEDFSVFAGSASFLYPAYCVGARGGIAALANVAPRECAELWSLAKEGRHDEARRLQHRLLAPNAALTQRFGIPGLKAALGMVGLETSAPRQPLAPANEQERRTIQTILEDAGILARV